MPDLAARIRAKYPGAYDDMDDAALEKSVLAKHPEYADLAKPESSPTPSAIDMGLADNPTAGPLGRGALALARLVKNHPMAAATMAGGALAAPVTGGASIPIGMAAAGLGAAGGAGAVIAGRQMLTGRPENATDTLGTMAAQGATAAVGQGAGQGIAKLAGAVAPKIAKGVLRLSPRLQQEYDDLVGTFLKAKIPVGESAKAGERMSASAATARGMAADAEAAGAAPVGAREIVKEFRPVRDEVANRAANARPGADKEMQEVVARAKGLRIKGAQSVTRNQELKQSAQSDAATAFRAQDRGAQINDVGAKLDKAVAVGRQKAAEARVPGIAAQNKETQNMMGLQDALESAQMKSQSPLGFNPINWAGAMMPGATSHAAFATDSLSKLPIGGAFRNALLAALGLSEDGTEGP